LKNLLNTISGYKIYEYQLVINPHEALQKEIQSVMKSFNEKYKTTTPVFLPHVLLCTFVQYEMNEARIRQKLQQVAVAATPFKIEVRDYGSYPTHSIFINVIAKVQLHNLLAKVRAETQLLMKLNNEHKPHFILEPNITIARKLKPWQYEKAWLACSNSHFSGKFIATEMLLYKRLVDSTSYTKAASFHFENDTAVINQGLLF